MEDHSICKTDVEITDKIVRIGGNLPGETLDCEGLYLVPGFLDIHTHGANDADPDDGTAEALHKMASYYAKNGVTSFCATTVTMPEKVLEKAAVCVRDYVRKPSGAKCIGLHLEGPFICEAKKGAMNPKYIQKPDVEMLRRLQKASGNRIVSCIVAPDMEGGLDFVREAKDICTISVGHTMADYETAMAAFEAGASRATHLYNAMPSFLHRAPGVIGAAFDSGAYVELICDGNHVHPCVLRETFRAFGDKVVMISDSLRCAGMPDGVEFEMGGLGMKVMNGAAYLPNGTLTGSVISVGHAVKRVIEYGVTPETAFRAASETPAKAIGVFEDRGSVSVGKCADLVLLNPDYSVSRVFVDGVQVAED